MITPSFKPPLHIHLVGIGGAGISAIAQVLLGRGFTVSGSDRAENELMADLRAKGATVYVGHAAAHIAGAAMVVISSAIPADNPEVAAAHAQSIPVLKRHDFLGQLMAGQTGIAIAGTHGKTTTTGLIAHMLLEMGRDPSVIMGGVLPRLGTNGRAGRSDLFVIEADEYDHMFLGLRPRLAVITTLEHDHPDIYTTAESYQDAFAQFVTLLAPGGILVADIEDKGVRQLLSDPSGMTGEPAHLLQGQLWSYSLSPEAHPCSVNHIYAAHWQVNEQGGLDFMVHTLPSSVSHSFRLAVPGLHNVRNALAAVQIGRALGLTWDEMAGALATFRGTGRRFEVKGVRNGVTVVDDYGHHPTEIRATLAAARQQQPHARIWAVWQPHTYSRTQTLLADFATCFADADRVLVLDIYASREKATLGLTGLAVAQAIHHEGVMFVAQIEDAAAYLLTQLQPGDLLITFSAGDGNQVGEIVLRRELLTALTEI
ncbi:MAG: UDP-N-acetylmuramate--L-alanine ligase [Chloroflexi bacterium]|nr:UDP-N-acetylmuramate--L-alanine ligase [Chloroflexota bacterium]MBP8054870.1 UDP-N-acetylmuramate--L-alanine ligase [Chloroflexota bacterium]